MKDSSMAATNSDKYVTFKTLYEKYNSDTMENFEFHFQNQFKGIELEGKRVLEIGCGQGFFSTYISYLKDVSSIDALDEAEGEGAGADVLNVLADSVKELRLQNINIIKSDLMQYHQVWDV